MTFFRRGRTEKDDNRWLRLLAVPTAVTFCAFLVLGTGIWVSLDWPISARTQVTESRESMDYLDRAISDLDDAHDSERGCSIEKEAGACARVRTDRRDFRLMVRTLSRALDEDPVRHERLRIINKNLSLGVPGSAQEPDPEPAAIVSAALKSLRNFEEMRFNDRLTDFQSEGVAAQWAITPLLTVGAILLLAGQSVLWKGLRNQRKAQEQLEELNSNLTLARREALALSEAKGRFLADMSHEIRTPLNGIVGMASMLSLRDLSPEDTEILRTIRASSDVLLRVVDDVLDLSKIDSNRVELLAQPLEFNTLLRDVSSLYKGMADDSRNRMVIEVPDTERWVLGDAVRLKQVFGNLVSNAVKFCREGEVRVSLSSSPEGVYRISVSDTGVGIAPDRIESIFDEFVQAQISVSQEHPGTGLGLAIARKLVRRMGGEISVSSTLGNGSEFLVVVPLGSCDPPTPSRMADAPEVSGLRILLAEDNNVNILVATAILLRAGCIVEVARDGIQATEMATAGSYDIILMDLRMPKRQGTDATIQILNEFKDRESGPRIIAMTANASPEDREACMSAGMVGFLSKPFTYEQLLETLGAVAPARV
jgi:signal transduction histidine kinase/ActR/RegA family two-component response regulator